MKASCEVIYPGCTVEKEGERYTVIKVNGKSFYCGKISWEEYCSIWDRRLKGTTFKEICTQYGIMMERYEGWEIDEKEAIKKEVIMSNTYKMDKAYKIVIDREIGEFKKKKKSIRLMTFWCGKGFIRVLEEREGCYLLNIDGEYILYGIENGEACYICKMREWAYDSIPWERLSKFAA